MTPRFLFRTVALAELVTWAGLISAIVLRAFGVTDAAVGPAGGIHGFVFLSYCAVTVFTWVDGRWRPATGALGLVAAVVPFATLPFERVVDRRGLLAAHWRLAPGHEDPTGAVEHAQAWVLRRPVTAAVLAIAGVAAVFVVLLWLGPPVPRA
ncbi:DUF3817 domain-containing protein [Microbacterium karelineae]|uniref:DUF3817 domain-containing protein n=1 Tax=Microbacterium karelineae TaxID=2654283 RepID=UPI0012EA2142|nr:DUF3817 domain-containing protein [Microbacterium karelineae]